MDLDGKDKARKSVLLALYRATDGVPGRFGELTPSNPQAFESTMQWLISAGYADGMFAPSSYAITYEGSQEMERLLRAAEARKTERAKDSPMNTEFNAETKSILFMDVKGWSKLTAAEIHSYVTRVMPKLAEPLSAKGGHLNTWGDAIIATFSDVKSAAEAALAIQHVFKTAYDHDGMPEGLSCRIALHSGEVVRIQNPVTGKEDVFGDAVHRAARLEPVTAPGFIFCTKKFAEGLTELKGSAPKAWPLSEIKLAKNYGTEEVYAVTAARDHDPCPYLATLAHEQSSGGDVPPPPVVEDIDDDSAILMLKGWIEKLPEERIGTAIKYTDVDATIGLAVGTAKRLMGNAAHGARQIEEAGLCFILRYDFLAISSGPERGGWDGFGL